MARYKPADLQPVDFAFIDGPVFIRPLAAKEKWEIESRMVVDPDTRDFANYGEFHAELIAASLVDEARNPVFTVSELRQVSVGHFAAMLAAINAAHTAAGSKKN